MPITASDLQRVMTRQVHADQVIRDKTRITLNPYAYFPPMMGLEMPRIMAGLDLWKLPTLQIGELILKSGLAEMGTNFSNITSDLTRSFLFDSLQEISLWNTVTLPFNFQDAFAVLLERIQAGEEGRTVLTEMDEPWLVALYDTVEFATLLEASDDERQAFLDATAEELLEADDFRHELRELVESLTLTRPRWRILDAALTAHAKEQYLYSIPLLLAQLEGMLADLLVVSQRVKRQGRRLYQLDPVTGQVLMVSTKNGLRPKEVGGLERLVQLSGFKERAYLDEFAAYILNHTCSFRNGTLHGSLLDFDTKQHSYRTAMLLFIVAREFSGLAEGIADGDA